MSEEKKTETEQLVDELTGKNQEEPEEPSEKSDEPKEQPEETEEDEILSEVEREIESYSKKSEELDARLAEFKSKKVDEVKRNTMLDFNYTEAQIERYSRHIEGETADEIKESVFKLMSEIPPKDNYTDPSLLNGKKQKPKTADPGEIGKKAFERVKHKVFPFFGRR